ncbi:MFS transporter [Aneurinibacillus migulanus]|uniref:MFS transporter, FSR family, fosmidomycin resistance protein n=1 Tax=Aneurinibacillus migulanus TaxID=47500 RepID=A0A0K2WG41_ANEMI|nr:MFS transporter [Aneurinibacillus migulanus]MED0892284.1 MFS transporter [Aneurinibacillus migulanus]MED1615764.1 MFS transporter [Aneurinibacillus migulanus]MED4731055.1 MFS transporter [Aneurinibacillus migulanus]CEH30358.1 Putative fosmidomycin resistance protein [Aneurinibacillus migulanus]SDI23497.1 MFS transporter, FSR family, fosmidomycin resistance protein [Aneurinibacillus migulanus]
MGAISSKLVQQQSGEKSFTKLKKRFVYTIGGSHLLNDMMTVGIVPALLPLYKQAFNLNYTQTGLIVLISYLTSSVMQPLFGYLTDKKPKPWALPLGVLLTGLGLSITGYVTNYYFLLLAVAISGLGSGIFHPESNRCVFLASGNERGKAQAIYQVGGNSGQALGALLIPLFLLSSGLKSMWVFFLLGILSFVMTIWMIPWYKEQLSNSMKLKKKLQGKSYPIAMLLLLIVVILRSWVQIGVAGFLPFYGQEKGISLHQAEIYVFLFLGAGAIGTYIGGQISDRLSRKSILLWSLVASIPFSIIMPMVDGIMLPIILFIFGFTILSSFAVGVVYAQMLMPNKISMVSGLMIGFGVGAGGIGATFMGAISDHYGVDVVMHLFSIFIVVAVLFTLCIPSDRKL